MKRLILTLVSVLVSIGLHAQLGNKVSSKNMDLPISVKPSSTKLKNVKVPKNLDVNKVARLKVPKNKIKLPSRKNLKISPKKLYTSQLQIQYEGEYNKNYLNLNTGIVTYNAQRGKEYRAKIILADKKFLVKDRGGDIPNNGYVLIKVGNQNEWYTLPVSQSNREFNIVFTASSAGPIQLILGGMRTPNREGGEDWWDWLPLKSIQVDEI